MVQEQLAAHDPEGEVVHAPASEEEATESVVLNHFRCDEKKMRVRAANDETD